MKSSEFVLNVSSVNLSETLNDLENGNERFLSLADNLFLIKHINTCLRIKTSINFNYKSASFKFSYDDENFKNMIVVKYTFEDDSCYAFLKETDFISQEQLQIIKSKSYKFSKQLDSYRSIDDSIEQVNNMVYSEALSLMTSAINKEDFDMVKTDFESKYLAWKARKKENNENAVALLEQLYNKILRIKLSERI